MDIVSPVWSGLSETVRLLVPSRRNTFAMSEFRAKDVTVSGSFTVADDGGKVKYTVVGAVVGGRLYCTAYSKKAPSLPATAE